MKYIKLTAPEIYDLPRDTLFTVVISPIEVHGPHLPVGTDILIAKYLQKKFEKEWKDTGVVRLPDLPIGCDPQPVSGSFSTPCRSLKRILVSWGLSLKSMGFRYLLVFDNHGGPRHQIALYESSLYLRRRGFTLIVPFLHIMHEMLTYKDDIRDIGDRGMVGDIEDIHAGTNESSIMMASHPSLVKKPLPGKHVPALKNKALKKLFKTMFGPVYGDLAGTLLAWTTERENPGYIGDPSQADKDRGKAMLRYHIKRYIELTKMAYLGTYSPHPPLTPVMRILMKAIPEERMFKKKIIRRR